MGVGGVANISLFLFSSRVYEEYKRETLDQDHIEISHFWGWNCTVSRYFFLSGQGDFKRKGDYSTTVCPRGGDYSTSCLSSPSRPSPTPPSPSPPPSPAPGSPGGKRVVGGVRGRGGSGRDTYLLLFSFPRVPAGELSPTLWQGGKVRKGWVFVRTVGIGGTAGPASSRAGRRSRR